MGKIFGIGLSRTGTTSLNDTLRDEAGINMIHYPNRVELFHGNYDGATDIPVALYFMDLDKKFPDSKFILTVRDKYEWLESIVPYFERKRDWPQSKAQIQIREMIYGSAFPTEFEASLAYDRHHALVGQYFYGRNDLIEVNVVGGDDPENLWKFLTLDSEPPACYSHKNKLRRKSNEPI